MSDPSLFCIRQFQGAQPGPKLLITGGVHGDEFEPMVAIRQLIERYSSDLGLTERMRGQLTLIPVVNVAAFLRGHRTAEDNLDLARVCPGDPLGSITQRTAHLLSQHIREADFYIDLHTGGTELNVLPLAGYTLHSDPRVLDQQRRMAHAFNLPITWGTSAEHQGRSLSVARDANVPAIYAEHGGSALCRATGVADYVAGCFNVMREVSMIDGPPPASCVRHQVEDPRGGSGHMQVANPSPLDGFFEPDVQLGERVSSGQSLGTVVDVIGEQSAAITAQQTGLVLVLRTFPRVRQGESVGVILELPDEFT